MNNLTQTRFGSKSFIRTFTSSSLLRMDINSDAAYDGTDLRKKIFLKNKIKNIRPTLHEEIIRRWVIKTEQNRGLKKDIEKIDKASSALNAASSDEIIKESEGQAYYDVRSKYLDNFRENSCELKNPTASDVLEMDKITLGELKEMKEESLNIRDEKYEKNINALWEGYTAWTRKRKRSTPTSDFVDDLPQDHNPLNDLGDD